MKTYKTIRKVANRKKVLNESYYNKKFTDINFISKTLNRIAKAGEIKLRISGARKENNKLGLPKYTTLKHLEKIRDEVIVLSIATKKNPKIIKSIARNWENYIYSFTRIQKLDRKLKEVTRGIKRLQADYKDKKLISRGEYFKQLRKYKNTYNLTKQELDLERNYNRELTNNPFTLGLKVNQYFGEQRASVIPAKWLKHADKSEILARISNLDSIFETLENENYDMNIFYDESIVDAIIAKAGGLQALLESNPEALIDIARRSGTTSEKLLDYLQGRTSYIELEQEQVDNALNEINKVGKKYGK